jgi:glycosyltransferase involved in cell wall biosynthesis
MRIFQHIDELHPYDGMGNDCRGFQNFFSEFGIENYIITRDNKSLEIQNIFSTDQRITERDSDVHILHYGGAGYPLDNFILRRGKKILRFHNITPHEFFKGGNLGVYLSMEKFFYKSVFELKSMENRIDLCISDSDYNSATLSKYIRLPSVTIPIQRKYRVPIAKEKFATGRIQLVFLSRFVPNKKIEDCILVLYYLKKIHSKSNLQIIGGVVPGIHDYYDYLRKHIEDLELTDSVTFHKKITEENKDDLLRSSDFFLCMSEHEGFGIPIIEAMENSLPVLAYNSSAIGETMKSGGILILEKNFPAIAELILELQNNPNLEKSILENQKKALNHYIQFPWKEKIHKFIIGKSSLGNFPR